MKNKYTDIAFNKISKIENIVKSFSLTEKIVFIALITIFIISTLGILINVNNNFLVTIPDKGGDLIEGVIGTPRFINPVIANSSTDKDLTSLIYSGLVRISSDGQVLPDLAKRFEVSEDGLIYDFYLREEAKFHNGSTVTADDVVYTILKIKDPEIRSPYISDWENVVTEKVSDRQVRFILNKVDPDFILKNDIGILPKILWQEVTNDAFSLNLYNIEPIGSGPYYLDKIEKDNVNVPKSYILKSYKEYSLGEPKINKIIFKFTKNEEELIEMFNNKKINAINSISPTALNEINLENLNSITVPLPRVFGLFINQSESPALSIKSAREALQLATPKQRIIDEVFNGYAIKTNSPIPGFDSTVDFNQDLVEAENILIKAGWEKNEDGIYALETNEETYLLSTSISTSNIDQLVEISKLITEEWKKIGVDVSVKVFNPNDISQNVIRPRNFEILLFGNIINDYSELYAFWHSSRRNDPGLNITNYANIETDTVLERLLNSQQPADNTEDLKKLISEIQGDIPAIFLYNPQFIYLISKDIQGVEIDKVTTADDRFNNVNEWFINTDRVWNFFTK